VGAGGAEPGEDDEPVAPAVPAVLPPPSPRRTAIGTPLTAAIADTVLEAIRARARRAGPPAAAAAAAAAAAPHPLCAALLKSCGSVPSVAGWCVGGGLG
jgi:hypothetical protein